MAKQQLPNDWIAKAKRHPYRHLTSDIKERVNGAIRHLTEKGMARKVAVTLFGLTQYYTSDDLDELWRVAYKDLDKWFREGNINPSRDVHFLHVHDEPHFVDFCRATGLKFRKDPEMFPTLKTVDEIWDKIKLIVSRQHDEHDIEQLQSIAERGVWVLLWDLNLSGKTCAKELERLAKCARILMPPHTRWVLLSQIASPGAEQRITQHFHRHKVEGGHQFYGCRLTEDDCVQTITRLSKDMREQVTELCKQFYKDVFEPTADKGALRDVGEYGYGGGGLFLVTQENCPNNSLPILWYESPSDKEESARYQGPFPRIPSTLSHKSLAPYDLDKLDRDGERYFESQVANCLRRPDVVWRVDVDFIPKMTKLPMAWGRTNHSKHQIRYRSVLHEHWVEIGEAARKFFDKHVASIKTIEQLDEDTGTLNFRVDSEGKEPILFRVHKKVREEDIVVLDVIHRLAEKVSSELPEFSHYLSPLKPSGKDRPRGCQTSAGFGALLSAYNFLDKANHFSGYTLGELESVGEKFGRMQSVLSKMARDLLSKIDFAPLEKMRTDLAFGTIDIFELYKEIARELPNRERSSTIIDIPYDLMRNARDILARAVERCDEARYLMDRSQSPVTVALLDFHPHNTLVKDKKCVLIYDFEGCLPQVNQAAALAFGVHRFTREWIIKSPETHGSRDKVQAMRARDAFLESYKRGGGEVPGDFDRKFPALIRWMNMHKLLGIYQLFNGRREDRSMRSIKTFWDEMRKFVMYIQEAELYEG